MKKRLLALLLVAVMVVSILPMAVFANSQNDDSRVYTWTIHDYFTENFDPIENATGHNLNGEKFYFDGIEVAFTDGNTATRFWKNSGTVDLRIYSNGGSIAFNCPESRRINKIEFFGKSRMELDPGSTGSYVNPSNKDSTWTAADSDTKSVKFNALSTAVLDKVVITYTALKNTVTNGTPESDSAKNHGYITVDETAAEGETVTVTVKPNEGYKLKSLSYVHKLSAWSVIGDFGGDLWTKDIPMAETEPGVFVSPVLTLSEGNQFKVRKDADWTVNYGGPNPHSQDPYVATVGSAIAAASEGENISVPSAGTYIVTLNLNDTTITLTSATTSVADPVAITVDANGKYTFTMPAYDVTVTAEFEAAGGTGSGEWFGYCTEDSQFESSIGVGGGMSITYAIKIPVASLPNQDVLSKVSFYAYYSDTYHVRIYSTDPSTADPGTADPDYEQEFTVSNPGQWEDVVLTTPYEVDKTKDLWIGIENTDSPYPATYSSEDLGTTDCCMMYYQDAWYPITDLGSFDIHPWMIRGYFGIVGKTLPYSFDFETDPFENGWTTIDADGDGYDWETDTDALWDEKFGIDEGHCAVSRSYENYVGARSADNWLFSPAITIPAGGAIVSWYERSQDPNYPDSYEVYICETNTSTDTSKMTEIFSGKAANPWNQRSVELKAAEYAGKTVYIAFRHLCWDCYFLEIDDFAVEALTSQYHYTTYENWQIKYGNSWEWTDNMTKVADGLYIIEILWEGTGFNVKSDENPIKKDWYAPEELIIGEEVLAPVTVDVYLRVIDDETVKIGVGVDPDPPHTHTGTKQNGQPATETAAGWSDYYKCDCGLYFEDEDCTIEIGDDTALASWKTGDGAIAILVHTITPVSAQAATQTEPGFKAYYECKNCGKYYEDAEGKNEITDLSAWKAKGGNGYIPSGNEIDAAKTAAKAALDAENAKDPLIAETVLTNGKSAIDSAETLADIENAKNAAITAIQQAQATELAGAKKAAKSALDTEEAKDPLTDKTALTNGKDSIDGATTKAAVEEAKNNALEAIKNAQKSELDAAKASAKTDLDTEEAKDPLTDKTALTNGKDNIDGATTKAAVEEAKNAALEAIKNAQKSELDAAKDAAKAALDAEEAKDPLTDKTALTNGKDSIDEATTKAAVEEAKNAAITAIQEAQAGELANAKDAAKAALDNEDAKDPLTDKTALTNGKNSIDGATTKAAVEAAKNTAITAIQEAQATELANAKDAAKSALDTEEAKDPLTDKTALTNGKNSIDGATTKAAVEEAKNDALDAIKNAQKSELDAAKASAKSALDTEEAKDPLTDKTALTNGKDNIDGATTKAAVEAAKNAAVTAIQEAQATEHKDPKDPDAGDASKMTLWMILALFASAGIYACLEFGGRRKAR